MSKKTIKSNSVVTYNPAKQEITLDYIQQEVMYLHGDSEEFYEGVVNGVNGYLAGIFENPYDVNKKTDEFIGWNEGFDLGPKIEIKLITEWANKNDATKEQLWDMGYDVVEIIIKLKPTVN
jgi:hypothetical protein